MVCHQWLPVGNKEKPIFFLPDYEVEIFPMLSTVFVNVCNNNYDLGRYSSCFHSYRGANADITGICRISTDATFWELSNK